MTATWPRNIWRIHAEHCNEKMTQSSRDIPYLVLELQKNYWRWCDPLLFFPGKYGYWYCKCKKTEWKLSQEHSSIGYVYAMSCIWVTTIYDFIHNINEEKFRDFFLFHVCTTSDNKKLLQEKKWYGNFIQCVVCWCCFWFRSLLMTFLQQKLSVVL